jgi:hypothetical protein
LFGNEFRSEQAAAPLTKFLLANRSLFTQVFANGLRHLEHIQSSLSKDWFQLVIGYNFPPLLRVLQLILFDVGTTPFSRPVGGIWERPTPAPRPIVETALKALEPSSRKRRLSFASYAFCDVLFLDERSFRL